MTKLAVSVCPNKQEVFHPENYAVEILSLRENAFLGANVTISQFTEVFFAGLASAISLGEVGHKALRFDPGFQRFHHIAFKLRDVCAFPRGLWCLGKAIEMGCNLNNQEKPLHNRILDFSSYLLESKFYVFRCAEWMVRHGVGKMSAQALSNFTTAGYTGISAAFGMRVAQNIVDLSKKTDGPVFSTEVSQIEKMKKELAGSDLVKNLTYLAIGILGLLAGVLGYFVLPPVLIALNIVVLITTISSSIIAQKKEALENRYLENYPLLGKKIDHLHQRLKLPFFKL